MVFIKDGGNLLLAKKKRSIGKGKWNGPGGKIEAGETPEQAMIRECQEEIELTPIKYYKAAELKLHEYHNNQAFHIFAHVYVCSKWSGQAAETDEMAPAWFDLAKLPYKDMWADDPFWLPQVLEGKKLKAEFRLDKQDKIISKSVVEVAGFA